jgi:hypothetical protein
MLLVMADHSSPTALTTAWHTEAVPAEVVVVVLPAEDGRRRRPPAGPALRSQRNSSL